MGLIFLRLNFKVHLKCRTSLRQSDRPNRCSTWPGQKNDEINDQMIDLLPGIESYLRQSLTLLQPHAQYQMKLALCLHREQEFYR